MHPVYYDEINCNTCNKCDPEYKDIEKGPF